MHLLRHRPSRLLASALLLGLLLLTAGTLTGGQRSVHAGITCSPPNILIGNTCNPPPNANPASLIVTKVVVGGPAVPSDFGFTVTIGGVPVTGEQHPAPGASTTFVLLFNATVTVEETTTQPNYVVDNSNCVNVLVSLGAVTRCTITNTYQPPPPPPPPPVVTTLTVAKITSPATTTAFDFSSSVGAFSLQNGDTATFSVTPGGHFLEEALPPDWQLESIVCSGGDPGVVSATRVTLTINAGESITCTFRNQLPPPPPAPNPSLSLQKLTNGLDIDIESGDVPELTVGDDVVWSYRVTNTGDVTLFNVQIVDDAGTPQDPEDDFVALGGVTLAPGESAEVSARGVVIQGPYINTARASAEQAGVVTADVFTAALSAAAILTASDDSGYLGVPPPAPPPAPLALPDAGSGGAAGAIDTFGWRLSLTGLIVLSGLSFVGGVRLLRGRRPARR